MRIPNTAEFLALFVSTGQLTGFSNQPVADLEALAGPDEPPCIRRYPLYIVQAGDTCNSIALNSPFRMFPTYQIMCGNEEINGKCTNLRPGQELCLARTGEACTRTSTVTRAGQDARSIASQFGIDLYIFEANNYCDGSKCPPFPPGTVVCVSPSPTGKLRKCEKILV